MTLQDRLYAHLTRQFQFDPALRSQPGTTIMEDERREPGSYAQLWTIENHVYVRVHPGDAHKFRAVLEQHPPSHRLTLHEVTAHYPPGDVTYECYHYVLDPVRFKPFRPADRYTVRRLTDEDQAAFDAFLACCSEEDQEEGDVTIDASIGVAFGVLDGARIVACASTYEIDGFTDVGILTDPDYRQQGLGKAAVSAVSEHFLDKTDLLLYRHLIQNIGSCRIVRGLNYWQFAQVDFLKF